MCQIEFNGMITGEAEKFYWKKSRDLGLKVLLVSIALVSPTFVMIGIQIHSHIPILICVCMLFLAPVLVHIPQSRKQKEEFTPRRIYTEDDAIIAMTQNGIERKYIEDAKCVYDHGEFYEFVFPFGKVSDKFICQKSLLTKGTLEDFEYLIGDKLIRK